MSRKRTIREVDVLSEDIGCLVCSWTGVDPTAHTRNTGHVTWRDAVTHAEYRLVGE